MLISSDTHFILEFSTLLEAVDVTMNIQKRPRRDLTWDSPLICTAQQYARNIADAARASGCWIENTPGVFIVLETIKNGRCKYTGLDYIYYKVIAPSGRTAYVSGSPELGWKEVK